MENKVVVITGGSRGLGKAMAEIFAAKKAKVIISSRDEKELQQVSKEINAIYVVADVTNEKQVNELAQKVVVDFGQIDIWINNAGIWMPITSIEEIDNGKTHKLFEVNFFGTLNGMKAAVRQMKTQAQGTIVNIISTTALDGMKGSSGSMYAASKYAVRGMTNAVRIDLEETGISIISVYPGGIKTELFEKAVPDNFNDFMSTESVAQKIVENLENPQPEIEQILKRPSQVTEKAR